MDHRQEGRGDDVAEARQSRTRRRASRLRRAGARATRRRVRAAARRAIVGCAAAPTGARALVGRPLLNTRHTDALRTKASTPKTSQAAAARPAATHHRAREQPADDDSGARPREHRAAERGPAARREPRQAPARGMTNTSALATPAGSAAPAIRRDGSAIARVRTPVATRPTRTSVGPSTAAPRHARPEHRLERQGSAPRGSRGSSRSPASSPRQVDDAVVQHHRQDRREREAADAHRDRERDSPATATSTAPGRCSATAWVDRSTRQLDELDPVGVAPDRLVAELGKRAARAVDRIAAQPMRRLADGDEAAAVGRDREAARLGLGRHGLDLRQRAARGIDRERGERARAALARVEKAAVGREMQVGGPRRAAGELRRQCEATEMPRSVPVARSSSRTSIVASSSLRR